MKHPCEILYAAGANGKIYGENIGICRITGKAAKGEKFEKWVRKTFTNYAELYAGTIISNDALFCFEEGSELLAKLTGKEKPQRMRNYTHIVESGKWHILNKAQKQEIYMLLIEKSPDVCVIAESGQRHLIFKYKPGTWLFEDTTIMPDKDLLQKIKIMADELIAAGFSKAEIQTGEYKQHRILKYGVQEWKAKEAEAAGYRGSSIFDLAIWLSGQCDDTQ